MAKIYISKRVICVHYNSAIVVIAISTPGSFRSMSAALNRCTLIDSRLRKHTNDVFLQPPYACNTVVGSYILPASIMSKLRKVNQPGLGDVFVNKLFMLRLFILLKKININKITVW
jgi:hypothetical protein